MSKSVFVEQLAMGSSIDSEFVITSSNVYEYSKGLRLALRLADRTGKVDAVWWDCPENAAHCFPPNALVTMTGKVGTFRDKPQVTVESMRVINPDEVDIADFVQASPRDPEEMKRELRELVATLEDDALRNVCERFFDDESYEAFCKSPGGKKWHHGYLHGLLEHVLSVMQACDLLCRHYDDVNRDVVLTAALLHDLGKTRELADGLSIDYTTPGRLLGHQIITIPIVNRLLNAAEGLSTERKLEVLHAIAAHHGEEEGSLVKPATREALLLHVADNLDAKMNAWKREIDAARNNGREWTDFVKLIGRFLYAGPPAGAGDFEADSSQDA